MPSVYSNSFGNSCEFTSITGFGLNYYGYFYPFILFLVDYYFVDFSWFWLFHIILVCLGHLHSRDDYPHWFIWTCLFTTCILFLCSGAGFGAGLQQRFWAATSACCFSCCTFSCSFARRCSAAFSSRKRVSLWREYSAFCSAFKAVHRALKSQYVVLPWLLRAHQVTFIRPVIARCLQQEITRSELLLSWFPIITVSLIRFL